ncbi:hypothetical protein Syun_031472 [Stephania yunnanensis]|uniref:ribose-5-phosphate isomerase n=1 Tax=Stephania yunnanensis TaxID=152371 RepID=A0AAP0E3L8_9MAGN
MQATIPPKTLISPTKLGRRFHFRNRKNPSLSISAALSKNVTTPEAQDAIKRALAKKAVGLVKSGMVVGLGTGSTASIAIQQLGTLITQGKLKNVVAVGANYQSRVLARQYGVKTVDFNDINNIDIVFDGADEVDFNKNLLKGGGAAHTMQKVVDSMAKECVILADESKVVFQLGSTFPVPPDFKQLSSRMLVFWDTGGKKYNHNIAHLVDVLSLAVEVIPPAISPVLRRLVTLGGIPEIRSALRKDGPVITDLGNMVVDVSFPNGIENPADLEKSINLIPGVVDNGIVSGIATSVLVAIQDGDSVTVMNLEEYVKIVGVPSNANSTI